MRENQRFSLNSTILIMSSFLWVMFSSTKRQVLVSQNMVPTKTSPSTTTKVSRYVVPLATSSSSSYGCLAFQPTISSHRKVSRNNFSDNPRGRYDSVVFLGDYRVGKRSSMFPMDTTRSTTSQLYFSTTTPPPPPPSSSSSSENKSTSNMEQKQQQQTQAVIKNGSGRFKSNTGGLRKLPVVKSPTELLNKARKAPLRIKNDLSISNIRTRARKHGAETLNAYSQALCLPLRDIVTGYQDVWRKLHPFEKVVADLTARARQKRDGLTLPDVLQEIHESKKILLEATKDWIYKVKHAETAKEANILSKEGQDHLLQLFEEFATQPVLQIVSLQRGLRSAPAVQLDTPAVVLVGAPNVGKSSIVRWISSATPEVNNYPFTTRGMTLGHVEVFWSDDDTIAKAVVPDPEKGSNRFVKTQSSYAFSQLCQVMDSPGVLVRPDGEERNEMEELTLAAMKHLPTAVMYVMDLSGQAGDKCSSVQDQLQLRKEIRSRFPRRPWIDVVSKIDLGTVDGAIEELEEILDGTPYIRLSIHEGDGIGELRTEVLRMLGEVRVVLDAMAAVDERSARQT